MPIRERGRRLYHYTAEHHAEQILKSGAISRGGVPIPAKDGDTLEGVAPGWQWLTSSDDWSQSWATRQVTDCDRTECRFVVEIPLLELPRLYRWHKAAGDFGFTPELAERFAKLGGGDGDTSSWFIFRGTIPRAWLVTLERRPRTSVREVIAL